MEERIISYDAISEVPAIVRAHLDSEFMFVRHNSYKKLLFFKKSEFPTDLTQIEE